MLDDPLPWIDDIVRAERTDRIPVVLTVAEARTVLDHIDGVSRLVQAPAVAAASG